MEMKTTLACHVLPGRKDKTSSCPAGALGTLEILETLGMVGASGMLERSGILVLLGTWNCQVCREHWKLREREKCWKHQNGGGLANVGNVGNVGSVGNLRISEELVMWVVLAMVRTSETLEALGTREPSEKSGASGTFEVLEASERLVVSKMLGIFGTWKVFTAVGMNVGSIRSVIV